MPVRRDGRPSVYSSRVSKRPDFAYPYFPRAIRQLLLLSGSTERLTVWP